MHVFACTRKSGASSLVALDQVGPGAAVTYDIDVRAFRDAYGA